MPTIRDLQPLLDVRQNQLSFVAGDGVAIDTKALAILATNVALMIFVAQAELHISGWLAYGLLFAPYVISLILDTLAIWPRAYAGASVELEQHPEYLELDEETLVLQLLADTEAAIHKNEHFNRIRWRYCVWSIILTAIGTAALFVILRV